MTEFLLPGLPVGKLIGQDRIVSISYSPEQMSEYGRFCSDAARKRVIEECASICDDMVYALDHGGNKYFRPANAEKCAAKIRELLS